MWGLLEEARMRTPPSREKTDGLPELHSGRSTAVGTERERLDTPYSTLSRPLALGDSLKSQLNWLGESLWAPLPMADHRSSSVYKPRVRSKQQIEAIGLEGHLEKVLGQQRDATSLDLSDNFIGEEGAALVSKALADNPYIRRLNLERSGFGRQGFAEIGRLVQQSSTLETVLLGGFEPRPAPIGLEAPLCPEFCAGVASSPGLRALHLRHCELTAASLQPLAAALQDSATASKPAYLERLILSHNKLDATAVPVLCLILEVTGISHLDVSVNGLAARGGEYLAERLTKGCGLRRLYVQRNGMLMRGCAALARWFGKVRRLDMLDLRDNRLLEKDCAELCRILGKPVGTRTLQWDNGMHTLELNWMKNDEQVARGMPRLRAHHIPRWALPAVPAGAAP